MLSSARTIVGTRRPTLVGIGAGRDEVFSRRECCIDACCIGTAQRATSGPPVRGRTIFWSLFLPFPSASAFSLTEPSLLLEARLHCTTGHPGAFSSLRHRERTPD